MFRLKLAARWLLPLLAAAMLAWGFSSGERKQGVFTLSQDDSQLYRPNQIVIKFKDRQSFGPRLAKTGDASFNNLLKVHGISQLEQVWKGKSKLQKGPSAIALESIYYANFTGNESPAKVAAAFRTHPAVQYAEPLYLHWLDVTPNDPSFIQQAH
ncbi:MAG TPA: hypothetical protein VGA99_10195, partial [bacterium]